MYPVSRHGGTADSHSHSRSLAGQLYSPGWVSLQVLGSDISTASLGTTPGAPFLLMGALIPLASQDFCLMLQSTWGRRGQGMLADGPGSSLQAPGFILCPLPPGLAEAYLQLTQNPPQGTTIHVHVAVGEDPLLLLFLLLTL